MCAEELIVDAMKPYPDIPSGPFIVLASDPNVARRMRLHLQSGGIKIRADKYEAGKYYIFIGCVLPDTGENNLAFYCDAQKRVAYVHDGFLFEESVLGSMYDAERGFADPSGIGNYNGMYANIAVENASVRIVTDPWGSIPLYYYASKELFVASTSLTIINLARDAVKSISDSGLAQLLTFGTIINGETFLNGIFRLGRARVMRFKHGGDGRVVQSERVYYYPRIESKSHPVKEEDLVGSFSQALMSIANRANAAVVCTLSGGMDSRVIAAASVRNNLNFKYCTHFSQYGIDAIVANEVAKALNIELRNIPLVPDLALDFARSYIGLSNGMVSFDSYHAMTLYNIYGAIASYMVDGNHTSIEGRWFMRNNSGRAKTRDAFFQTAFDILRKNGVLDCVANPEYYEGMAKEILFSLTPDPRDYSSPGICADHFYIDILLPNHNADLCMIQNQRIRYVTPYYDLRYVSVVSRYSEKERWEQTPQNRIIQLCAPQLNNQRRSYRDVATFATANPYLLRVPVAVSLLKERYPPLRRMPCLKGIGVLLPSNTFRIMSDASLHSLPIPRYIKPEMTAGVNGGISEQYYDDTARTVLRHGYINDVFIDQ